VVPLVKLRLSLDKRLHYLAELIAVQMIHSNLGFTSNSAVSLGSGVDLQKTVALTAEENCGKDQPLRAKSHVLLMG